jgi:hypothetical protein
VSYVRTYAHIYIYVQSYAEYMYCSSRRSSAVIDSKQVADRVCCDIIHIYVERVGTVD